MEMSLRVFRKCRKVRAGLPLHFYGLLPDHERQSLERHLAACQGCAREWTETRRVLGAVDTKTAFPKESEVDWVRFARQTVARARVAESRLETAGAGGWPMARWARVNVAWGGVLAVAIVLTAVLLIQYPPPGGLEETPSDRLRVSPESTRFLEEAMARQGARRYLRDSRSLLVDLVQTPVPCRKADGAFDISLEKERARRLLRKKNLYMGSLDGLGDQRLASLMGQLESVLVQVSILDDCAAGRRLSELREAIERRQILMRIDLMTRASDGGAYRV
jgi:hypothetical protein